MLDATLEFANSKVSQKADDWTEDLKDVGDSLDDLAATGGAVEQAGYEGLKAELQGRNPVWAAVKGAWAGASGKVRLAAVLIVLLVLLRAGGPGPAPARAADRRPGSRDPRSNQVGLSRPPVRRLTTS